MSEKDASAHLDAALEAHNLESVAAGVERLASRLQAEEQRQGQGLQGAEAGAGHAPDAEPAAPSTPASASGDKEDAGGIDSGAGPDSAASAGQGGESEARESQRSLAHQLTRTTAELDKTKSLFSRAMLNAAALEMDIKKLQETSRADKVGTVSILCWTPVLLRALLFVS